MYYVHRIHIANCNEAISLVRRTIPPFCHPPIIVIPFVVVFV